MRTQAIHLKGRSITMTPTVLQSVYQALIPVVGVIATAFLVYLGARGTALANLLAAKHKAEQDRITTEKQAETTVIVKHIDDGVDFRHAQQLALDSYRQETAAQKQEMATFRQELDKAKNDLIDTREKLSYANIEIKQQAGQIVAINDENLRRKQEYEETLVKLQSENVVLLKRLDAAEAENRDLKARLDELGFQVNGNSKDIHEIGGIEVKVQGQKGSRDVSTSLQAIAEQNQG